MMKPAGFQSMDDGTDDGETLLISAAQFRKECSLTAPSPSESCRVHLVALDCACSPYRVLHLVFVAKQALSSLSNVVRTA